MGGEFVSSTHSLTVDESIEERYGNQDTPKVSICKVGVEINPEEDVFEDTGDDQ